MILEGVELLLRHVADLAIILSEFVGVFVTLITGAGGVWDYIKHNPQIRLNPTTGIALELKFKLGSEILRAIVVWELTETATTAAIIVLRTALTFLIHWEIKVEETDEEIQHHHGIPKKM